MKKIHVDEILNKKEDESPHAYNLPSSFGSGKRYSIGKKLDLFQIHLSK